MTDNAYDALRRLTNTIEATGGLTLAGAPVGDPAWLDLGDAYRAAKIALEEPAHPTHTVYDSETGATVGALFANDPEQFPVNTSPAQQIDAIMKRIRSGPEPKPDFTGHADRLDLIVTEIAELGHAFGATGNDRVAEHLCRIALDLSAEATVSRNFTRTEGTR